jgi:hypothetical protein
MIVFSVAFLPQFVRPAAGHLTIQLVVLGALFVAVQLAVDITLATVAGRIGTRLANGRTARWINRTCAAMFIAPELTSAPTGPPSAARVRDASPLDGRGCDHGSLPFFRRRVGVAPTCVASPMRSQRIRRR